MKVTEMLRAIPLMLLCTLCNAATVGVVKLDVDGAVNLYSLAEVKPQTQIQFQYPGADGSIRCCIRRRGSAFHKAESESSVQDANNGDAAQSYKLNRPITLKINSPFIGSAVVGAGRIRQLPDQALQIGPRIGGEIVRSCTSQEGVHVLKFDAKGVVSDLYLGLDYEVESPSCKATPEK
jgi:hypothetical protein